MHMTITNKESRRSMDPLPLLNLISAMKKKKSWDHISLCQTECDNRVLSGAQRTHGVHNISVRYVSVNKGRNSPPAFICQQIGPPQVCSHTHFWGVRLVAETTYSQGQLFLK